MNLYNQHNSLCVDQTQRSCGGKWFCIKNIHVNAFPSYSHSYIYIYIHWWESINRKIIGHLPNSWNVALHFLKLSSTLGNFKITLSNDFIELPSFALLRIASVTLTSSFVCGIEERDSVFCNTPPILPELSLNNVLPNTKEAVRIWKVTTALKSDNENEKGTRAWVLKKIWLCSLKVKHMTWEWEYKIDS